jgi:cell shape-determining protein MreD
MVILGIALQSSLFSSWPFLYFQPDVTLLVVVWCALRRGFIEGGVLSLILAEICEIHSAAPQGLYLLTYILVYFAVRASARFLVVPTLFSYSVLALVSSMVFKLSGLIVLSLLGAGGNQWKHTFTFLLIGAAVEGGLSLFIFRSLDRFDWFTFKNARTEHSTDPDMGGELQFNREGF